MKSKGPILGIALLGGLTVLTAVLLSNRKSVTPTDSSAYVPVTPSPGNCSVEYTLTPPSPTPTRVPPTPTPPITSCGNVDVALIMDRSSSMTSNYCNGSVCKTKLEWEKDAVKAFLTAARPYMGTNGMKMGLVSFGWQGNREYSDDVYPTPRIKPTGYPTPGYDSADHLAIQGYPSLSGSYDALYDGLTDSVYGVQFKQSGSCLECGLVMGRRQVLPSDTRRYRVAVMFSDGRGNKSWDGTSGGDGNDEIAPYSKGNEAAIAEALLGKNNRIEYYVLGYGNSSSINEPVLWSISNEKPFPTLRPSTTPVPLPTAGPDGYYNVNPNPATWGQTMVRILNNICVEAAAYRP